MCSVAVGLPHAVATALPAGPPSTSDLSDTFQSSAQLEKQPGLKDFLASIPLEGEQFSAGNSHGSYLKLTGDTRGPGRLATGEEQQGVQFSESFDANIQGGLAGLIPPNLHLTGTDFSGVSIRKRADSTSFTRRTDVGVEGEVKAERGTFHPNAPSKPGVQVDAFIVGAEAGLAGRAQSNLESSPTRLGADASVKLKAGAALNRGIDVKASTKGGSSLNFAARGGAGPAVGGSAGAGFSRDKKAGETHLGVQLDLAVVFEADVQADITIKDKDYRAFARNVWAGPGAVLGAMAGPTGMKVGQKVAGDIGEKLAETELSALDGAVTLVNQGYQKLHKAQVDLTAMAQKTVRGLVG